MYKQAYKNQLIVKNPVPLATLPKFSAHKERRVLTLEEQTLFLKHATGAKYDYVYELALSTGMRSGKMCGLEWQDVDFSNRIIHVRGTMEQKISIGAHWQPLDGLENLIITTETGRPLGKGYLNKEISKIVKYIQEADSEFMDLYAHVLPDTKVLEMQKIANLF